MGVDCSVSFIVYVDLEITFQNLKHILNLCCRQEKFNMDDFINGKPAYNANYKKHSKQSFSIIIKNEDDSYVSSENHLMRNLNRELIEMIECLSKIKTQDDFDKIMKKNKYTQNIKIYKQIYNTLPRAYTLFHTENITMDDENTKVTDFTMDIENVKRTFLKLGFNEDAINVNIIAMQC